MKDEESLEAGGALVSRLPDPVQEQINNLLAEGGWVLLDVSCKIKQNLNSTHILNYVLARTCTLITSGEGLRWVE